jgi:hypothetical protein
MKRISKDLADKMVMDVLVTMSKMDNISSEFAKNSIDIMNDSVDNSVFTGVLMAKARPSLFDDNEIDMKVTIMSALTMVFDVAKKNKDFEFNNDLSKELLNSEKGNSAINTKLDFALNQFVNAFYEYQRLENKYPELMKFM